MTAPATLNPIAEHPLRTPILWGLVFGVIQAAVPLSFWWLDPATVYALSIVLIAAVYIGFAVADGRPKVIVIEVVVVPVPVDRRPGCDVVFGRPLLAIRSTLMEVAAGHICDRPRQLRNPHAFCDQVHDSLLHL